MDFLTLKPFTFERLRAPLLDATRLRELTNVFNPSVATLGDSTYMTFRAESSPGAKPFRGYLGRVLEGGELDVVDLAALTEDSLEVKTADPKLVVLGEELYVTYNTGHVNEGQNDIFLQRIAPTPGPRQRCVFPQRRPVEKNWGFYIAPSGVLQAIYSLVPFARLQLTEGELGSSPALNFEAIGSPAPVDGEFPRVHIGSQPVVDGDRGLLIANQQIKLPKIPRKTYFGRIVEIDLVSGALSRISRRRLLHSWPSMLLPQIRRHNPMLWSATYFSGLEKRGDELVLGYGINDREFGVARIEEERSWS